MTPNKMEANQFYPLSRLQHPAIFPLATCLHVWPLFPAACHAYHFPSARLRECCYLLAENAFKSSSFPLLETTRIPDNSFSFKIIFQILTMWLALYQTLWGIQR